MRATIWDFLVRLRTRIIAIAGIALLVLPDLINMAGEFLHSPELVAVLPPEWKSYIGLAALVLTLWSRWRPATRADDPEVQVKKAIDATPGPTKVEVRAARGGATTAVIDA